MEPTELSFYIPERLLLRQELLTFLVDLALDLELDLAQLFRDWIRSRLPRGSGRRASSPSPLPCEAAPP